VYWASQRCTTLAFWQQVLLTGESSFSAYVISKSYGVAKTVTFDNFLRDQPLRHPWSIIARSNFEGRNKPQCRPTRNCFKLLVKMISQLLRLHGVRAFKFLTMQMQPSSILGAELRTVLSATAMFRQTSRTASDDLASSCGTSRWATRAAVLSRSDLVLWHFSDVSGQTRGVGSSGLKRTSQQRAPSPKMTHIGRPKPATGTAAGSGTLG